MSSTGLSGETTPFYMSGRCMDCPPQTDKYELKKCFWHIIRFLLFCLGRTVRLLLVVVAFVVLVLLVVVAAAVVVVLVVVVAAAVVVLVLLLLVVVAVAVVVVVVVVVVIATLHFCFYLRIDLKILSWPHPHNII